MKKMLTILNNCKVYKTMNKDSNVVAEVERTEYYEYKKISRINRVVWYQIVVDESTIGFVESRNCYVWEKGIVTSSGVHLIPEGADYSNKIGLNIYSIIQFINPHINKDSSYKIQTRQGVAGIVPSSSKIVELDWFFFRLLHIIVFSVTGLLSLTILLGAGAKRFGVFIGVLISAGIAMGITILVMILTFLIKIILFEIRVRF